MSNVLESLDLLFSGEPYSAVRKGRFVHKSVGFRITQSDTFSRYTFMLKGSDWYVTKDGLSEVSLSDFLSKFKMSLKDKENLIKGLSLLKGNGVCVTIEFYKLYRKVNYRVFSVTF